MGAEDVRALIESVGDLAKMIADADPKLKAEVYADLGIRLTYRAAENLVSVEAAPCATERVGGGTCQLARRDPLDSRRVARRWLGQIVMASACANRI